MPMTTQTELIKNAEEILRTLQQKQNLMLPEKTYLGVSPDLEN